MIRCDLRRPDCALKPVPAIVILLSMLAPVAAGGASQEQSDRGTSTIRTSPADTALQAPDNSAGGLENAEGVRHYHDGEWDLAAHHFRRALMADPDMAEAHFNLGLAFARLGKQRAAADEFKRALELAPRDPRIAEATILKDYLRR